MSVLRALRRRLARDVGAVLLPAALLVAVAGCGSPHVGAAGVSAAGGTGPLAFSACMRAHGIPDYPDPTAHGSHIALANGRATVNGVTLKETQAQVASAHRACVRVAGAGTAAAAPSARMKSEALAYAGCMRSHGVPSFPDPTFRSGGIQFADHGGYDPNSRTFTAANAACRGALGATSGTAKSR